MAFQFKPAQRTQVYLKILLKGPTGSGKTYGALHIADGLAPSKVLGADSEHERMLFYADVVPFQHGILEEHHPKAYIAAINAAVAAGFEVIIIDSLTHCWQNVLERKDAYDKANPRTNQWTNWAIFGAEWDELMRAILESPIHVICTARAKMAHEQVEVNGKKQVVKLGLAPQLRDNTEFEFSLCFDVETTVDNRHPAQVSKDNTGLFGEPGRVWDLADGKVPAMLRQWMASAKPPERPTPETQRRIDDLLLELPEAQQAKARRRIIERKQRGFPEADALEVLAQLQALVAAAKAAEARPTPAPSTPTPAASSAPAAPVSPAVADPAPMAPPPAPITPNEPLDDALENAHEASAHTLAAAESMTVTIGQEQKALRDLTTKALQKLRPLAAERENHALVTAIDTVLQARLTPPTPVPVATAPVNAPLSAEEKAARFEAEVARLVAGLGAPDLKAAQRTTITYGAQGSYQLLGLNSEALRRQRTSGLIRPEQAAAIDVVLAHRAAHPFDDEVVRVEDTLAPDEVSSLGINSRFD